MTRRKQKKLEKWDREWEFPEKNGCDHDFKYYGTSGNPYEGGTVWHRCIKCGVWRASSEDGTNYEPASYKPYLRTIADDMRDAGLNPDTADDATIERFLGG